MDGHTWSTAKREARAVCTLLAVALTSSCVSNAYTVSQEEMVRLVRLPPMERGRKIHAVQRFSTSDDPPPAQPWSAPIGEPSQGGPAMPPPWVGYAPIYPFYMGLGSPYYVPAPVVVIHDHHGLDPAHAYGPGGVASSAPVKSDAKDMGAALAAVAVTGIAVGVALAVTEGGRYDGLVAVHPHHPVHLMGKTGQSAVVGLDELQPGDVRPDTEAVLVGTEGVGMWHIGRAALSRHGWNYRFSLGSYDAWMPSLPRLTGGGGDLQIGYFPSQYAGILVTSGMLTGSYSDGDFASWRLGLEVQGYPVRIWRLHLGGYGAVGQEFFKADGGTFAPVSGNEPFFGFGGLAEIDLTTRLALTLRYGGVWHPAVAAQGAAPALSIGFAVY